MVEAELIPTKDLEGIWIGACCFCWFCDKEAAACAPASARQGCPGVRDALCCLRKNYGVCECAMCAASACIAILCPFGIFCSQKTATAQDSLKDSGCLCCGLFFVPITEERHRRKGTNHFVREKAGWFTKQSEAHDGWGAFTSSSHASMDSDSQFAKACWVKVWPCCASSLTSNEMVRV